MCRAHWEIKKTKTVGRGPVNILLLYYIQPRQYYNMSKFDTTIYVSIPTIAHILKCLVDGNKTFHVAN